MKTLAKVLKNSFTSATGKFDVYVCFMEHGFFLLRACLNNGRQRIFRLLEAGAQCAPYRISQEEAEFSRRNAVSGQIALTEMNFQTSSKRKWYSNSDNSE